MKKLARDVRGRGRSAKKAYADNLMKASHGMAMQFYIVITTGILYAVYKSVGSGDSSFIQLVDKLLTTPALILTFAAFEFFTIFMSANFEKMAMNIYDDIDAKDEKKPMKR